MTHSLMCAAWWYMLLFISIQYFVLMQAEWPPPPPPIVGSGTRRKFPAFCCVRVHHCRDGWGSTASHRWQAAGRDAHQGVLLCPGPSWKKHAGSSDCCTNHGITVKSICCISRLLFWRWFVPLLFPCKAVNRGKGLLPDPTAIQILSGLNNPATLKMLFNPLLQGNKQGNDPLCCFHWMNRSYICFSHELWAVYFICCCAGLLGAAPAMPLLANPALSAALLQLLLQNQAKAQQVLLHSSPLLWHASSCWSLIQLLIHRLQLSLAFSLLPALVFVPLCH